MSPPQPPSADHAVPLRETFVHCPRCAQPLPRPFRHPARCLECGFVYYFSPIAAVGAVLARPDGRVLLLVRGRDPQAGKWCLPGGFVDVGESLEEALKREVQEETGWTPETLRYLCSGPNQYDYAGIRVDVLDTFFWGSLPEAPPLVPQPGEVESFVWADADDPQTLVQLAFDSHRRALACYRAPGGPAVG